MRLCWSGRSCNGVYETCWAQRCCDGHRHRYPSSAAAAQLWGGSSSAGIRDVSAQRHLRGETPIFRASGVTERFTPLERPEEYGERELLTAEEVAALNHASDTRADQREGLTREQDVALAYNQFWWESRRINWPHLTDY